MAYDVQNTMRGTEILKCIAGIENYVKSKRNYPRNEE